VKSCSITKTFSAWKRKTTGKGRGKRHTETVANPCSKKCFALPPNSPVVLVC
jgi:hypothetical protein